MYKTLFFLSSVLADFNAPVIDCTTGIIASEDILANLPNAPKNSGDCVSKCTDSTCTDLTCLNNNDNVADCSYDVNALNSAIENTGTGVCAPNVGQWLVGSLDWSNVTKVTVQFEGFTTSTTINLGSTAECAAGPTGNPATCTNGICDITTFVKTIMTDYDDNIMVAVDTAASPMDLSQATVTATITATSGHVYAAAPTCTAIKTSQSDCENAGCKWCYDSALTADGYVGCGVSPSVCQNDGTSSTTSTASTASTSTTTTTTSAGSDSLLSVGFAAMIGAFIFKFM